MSDIGAFESGRWHFWQERCRIGSTSFENVGAGAAAAVAAGLAAAVEGAGAVRDCAKTTLPTAPAMTAVRTVPVAVEKTPMLFLLETCRSAGIYTPPAAAATGTVRFL
jgi:hypothetical protein